MMKKCHKLMWCILTAAVATFLAPQSGLCAPKPSLHVKKGPGVTAITKLSQYAPSLKGTPGDTPVYILDSGKPGGTVVIVGGTHGNEPAGYVTATLVVENAKPVTGKLIVVPYVNASAVMHPNPQKGSPNKFTLKTPGGDRTFFFGSRLTNPKDQSPDPEKYAHPKDQKPVEGSVARNLNRVHPGKPDGYLTEKIAYGIAELIRKEKADMSIDLHEATPGNQLSDIIIAHNRVLDMAAEIVMNLQMDGIKIRLDGSPANMRGLSHREWGDNTETLALLMETTNPAQGIGSENADENTILLGRDGKNPLAERVARHTTSVKIALQVYTEQHPKRPVAVEGLPSFADINGNLGKYLVP